MSKLRVKAVQNENSIEKEAQILPECLSGILKLSWRNTAQTPSTCLNKNYEMIF